MLTAQHAAVLPHAQPLLFRVRGKGQHHIAFVARGNQHVTGQAGTPLLDAVLQRGNQVQDKPFHVPGHKRGRVLDPGMQKLLGLDPGSSSSSSSSNAHNALRYDLTELAGLDYLSSPSGVIQQAQQQAAAAFGADATWFLVNGCSAGIHAAVMATVKPGQTLLLARNCHLSAFAACVLAGCRPLWLQPEQDGLHGVAHCVTPDELAAGFSAARAQGLAVGAVLVVSPTYYGAVARVQELAALAHCHGVPLLVDEAHGAHLIFIQQAASTTAAGAAGCPPTPPLSALSAGADVVLQSSHKVLTAMTQAAMMHVRGQRVSSSRISRALQVLQTSSPSCLLLSSLDAARRHATAPGSWSTPLAVAAAARSGLIQVPCLRLLQAGSCGCEASVAGFDPLRLVVNVGGLGLTGFDAAHWLEQQHSIVPELATAQLVVLVVGPGSVMEDAEALVEAFQQLSSLNWPARAHELASNAAASAQPDADSVNPTGSDTLAEVEESVQGSSTSNDSGSTGSSSSISDSRSRSSSSQMHGQWQGTGLSPRDAFFADTQVVPLQQAAGRLSAELLCPYPPGVPVVFPGEQFSQEAVELLQATLAEGGVVTGASDPQLQTVLVIAADV